MAAPRSGTGQMPALNINARCSGSTRCGPLFSESARQRTGDEGCPWRRCGGRAWQPESRQHPRAPAATTDAQFQSSRTSWRVAICANSSRLAWIAAAIDGRDVEGPGADGSRALYVSVATMSEIRTSRPRIWPTRNGDAVTEIDDCSAKVEHSSARTNEGDRPAERICTRRQKGQVFEPGVRGASSAAVRQDGRGTRERRRPRTSGRRDAQGRACARRRLR